MKVEQKLRNDAILFIVNWTLRFTVLGSKNELIRDNVGGGRGTGNRQKLHFACFRFPGP